MIEPRRRPVGPALAALGALAVWLGAAAGCVSSPSGGEPSAGLASPDGALSGQPPPGFAFDYRLDHGGTTPAMRVCHVRFKLVGGHTTVEAKLVPAAEKILVKVPAGRYQLLAAECDNGRAFAVPPVGVFPVEADKVTYLGALTLAQGMSGKTRERDRLTLDDKDSERSRDSVAELHRRGLAVLTWRWRPAPASPSSPLTNP